MVSTGLWRITRLAKLLRKKESSDRRRETSVFDRKLKYIAEAPPMTSRAFTISFFFGIEYMMKNINKGIT